LFILSIVGLLFSTFFFAVAYKDRTINSFMCWQNESFAIELQENGHIVVIWVISVFNIKGTILS